MDLLQVGGPGPLDRPSLGRPGSSVLKSASPERADDAPAPAGPGSAAGNSGR
ncbi:MAG: hypothetical protein R2705_03455 [Ilumatobacteraceae bacterium]